MVVVDTLRRRASVRTSSDEMRGSARRGGSCSSSSGSTAVEIETPAARSSRRFAICSHAARAGSGRDENALRCSFSPLGPASFAASTRLPGAPRLTRAHGQDFRQRQRAVRRRRAVVGHGCVESVAEGAEAAGRRRDVPPARYERAGGRARRSPFSHGKGERVLPVGPRSLVRRRGEEGTQASRLRDPRSGRRRRGTPDLDGARRSAEDRRDHHTSSSPWSRCPKVRAATVMMHPAAAPRRRGARERRDRDGVHAPASRSSSRIRPRTRPPPSRRAIRRRVPQREEWTSLKKALRLGRRAACSPAPSSRYAAYRVFTRQPKPPPPPLPPRPPWELALEKLDEVRHAGLLETQPAHASTSTASATPYAAISARASASTASSRPPTRSSSHCEEQGGGFVRFESGAELDLLPGPGIPLRGIAGFLAECDLVKFANLHAVAFAVRRGPRGR